MKYLLFLNTTLIIYLGFVFYSSNKEKPIYYVDNNKLFNEFEYKRELEKVLEKDIKRRKNAVDSLRLVLNEMQINYQKSSLQNNGLLLIRQMENHIVIKENEFERENKKEIEEMDNKIWGRINSYVAEYAKKNSIETILGSNGNGNIMFSAERGDITDELIRFINEKFKGKL